MRYHGGKHQMSKTILPFLLRHDPDRIIEPFIGGGSVMLRALRDGYDREWIIGDFDPDLSAYWRAVVEEGWMPSYDHKPTRSDYEAMRTDPDPIPSPLRGFCRTAASFGARPWNGYILDQSYATWANPWRTLTRVAEKDAAVLTKSSADILVHGGDYAVYEEFLTSTSVVYCDPPYAKTTGYSKDGFDSDRFWNTIREWSATCPVYVSEFAAPDDFVAVAEKSIRKTSGKNTELRYMSDQLFTLRDGLGDLPLTP